jgi:hypothetical protein
MDNISISSESYLYLVDTAPKKQWHFIHKNYLKSGQISRADIGIEIGYMIAEFPLINEIDELMTMI